MKLSFYCLRAHVHPHLAFSAQKNSTQKFLREFPRKRFLWVYFVFVFHFFKYLFFICALQR